MRLNLCVIGEQFEEPKVIGLGLSLRTKERLLQVWIKDGRNEKVRTGVSNKLRQILQLDPDSVTLYYKEHQKSIKVSLVRYWLTVSRTNQLWRMLKDSSSWRLLNRRSNLTTNIRPITTRKNILQALGTKEEFNNQWVHRTCTERRLQTSNLFLIWEPHSMMAIPTSREYTEWKHQVMFESHSLPLKILKCCNYKCEHYYQTPSFFNCS